MLMPKRVKHRKVHRGRRKGEAHRGTEIAFGDFALQAQGTCWLESRQIEAARRVITRYTRRGGKIWIRVFPAKPAETRMGSGKGAPDHWVVVIKPGRILFEIAGVREEAAREAMRLAAYKLPIPCRFVAKRENELPEGGIDYAAIADALDHEAAAEEAEDGEEEGSDE